ncbi:hypothetical protein ACFQJD_07345 [Haloplanus sp. GCM10025708]|uniref:hypothetical protein n=1 Tax=Haloferacaceae TaxID=1644056 RepID=UPI00360D8E44
MYDSEYGTDWTDIDRESILERAFALGVASVLDSPDEAEYRRLVDAADTTYDRSLVELAYNEGQRKARNRKTSADDPIDVWTALVGDDASSAEDADSVARGLPPALDRVARSPLPDDGRDRLRLPDFLTRE